MTPFLALYGYHPPSITSSLRVQTKVRDVAEHIQHQQQVLAGLKENLALAQNRMKQQTDQHHSERHFDIGDWVFVRLQPYKQRTDKNTHIIIFTASFMAFPFPEVSAKLFSWLGYGYPLVHHNNKIQNLVTVIISAHIRF